MNNDLVPPAPTSTAPLLPRLRAAGAATAVLAGRKLRTPGAIVLAYHDVGTDPTNTTDFYVSPELFRKHLEAGQRWGLRFVDVAELSRRFLAGESVDGLAAVVFDDSLVGVHHHAMPILAELEIPATIFAVTDRLGESPPWWPGAARAMTKAEVGEMAGLGFRFESHTRTHASLVDVSADQLVDEVANAKGLLEDLVGQPVSVFAYPFGHYDRKARDAVAEAGYEVAYSFLNGRVVPGMSAFTLPRLCMSAGQSLPRLAYHLARRQESWPESQLDAVGPR